ncbi:conserved hypothetical protein, partial [Ricinus communis]
MQHDDAQMRSWVRNSGVMRLLRTPARGGLLMATFFDRIHPQPRAPVVEGVTDQIGVGFHAARGFGQYRELAFAVHPADARVETGMMVVRQDADAALRRVELAAENVRQQDVMFVAARFAEGVGEHMHLVVGRLPAHVGLYLVAEQLAEQRHTVAVARGVDRLEIGAAGVVAFGQPDTHFGYLFLAGAQACDRHFLRIETGVRVGLIEHARGLADHGREDEVRLLGLDVLHDGREGAFLRVEMHIALAHLGTALTVVHEVAHDAVRLVGEDVVAADQVHPRAETGRHVVGEQGAVL